MASSRLSMMNTEPSVSSVKPTALKSNPRLDRLKLDAEKQEKISKSQRRYMKCSNGKCVRQLTEFEKRLQERRLKNKKPNFLCKSHQDKKLQRIFVEIGRKKRIESLEKDIRELDLKISAAQGKLYVKENEENFRKITENLETQMELEKEIEKTKVEISHIKSQFKRLDKQRAELKKKTESETKFAEHLKKANRQLEIYEAKVEKSYQQECLAKIETQRLNTLLKAMLHDRAYFNVYWKSMVKKLCDRKKFLLDMVERSIQGFSQDADFLDSLKQITNRRKQDLETAVAEMIKMKRQIDSNQNNSTFLGGKGKKRTWAPLLQKEIIRREVVDRQYTDDLNLYSKIIANIKKLTGDDTKSEKIDSKGLRFLSTLDNDSFQLFNFLNEIQLSTKKDYYGNQKVVIDANDALKDRDKTKSFLENKIQEQNKLLSDEIDATLKQKDDLYKLEMELENNFEQLMEIVKMLECDLTSVDELLGNNEKINARNLPTYLQIIEHRIHEMVAFVYCDQRDPEDILADSNKFIVRSLKRPMNKIIKIDDVMQVTQCAECGELEDVDQFSEKPVEIITQEEALKLIERKYKLPELTNRMHNLLSCSLPRSGVIASRRYAD